MLSPQYGQEKVILSICFRIFCFAGIPGNLVSNIGCSKYISLPMYSSLVNDESNVLEREESKLHSFNIVTLFFIKLNVC